MDDIHSIFSSTLYPNRKCTANIQTGQPGTKKRKAICRTETDRKERGIKYSLHLQRHRKLSRDSQYSRKDRMRSHRHRIER